MRRMREMRLLVRGFSSTRFRARAAVGKAGLDSSAALQLRELRRALREPATFTKLGIGGLDDVLSNIFQRTFASRMLPPAAVERLNLVHTKGILLYGPPGTGKTLCARQMGQLLAARTPKYVNGPEIFSSRVGESEENIRKIFEASERDWRMKGNNSPVHVVIFDEIDAVCKRRDGALSSGRSRVHDNVVNQLLTKMDGLQRQNNVLIIGVTNRKDLLDEALLRPGRLEVQIEINLPDERGRQQILEIHTRDLASQGMLSEDVDIQLLSAKTTGFTGAELEGMVRTSLGYALSDQHAALAVSAGLGNGPAESGESGHADEADLLDEQELLDFLETQTAARIDMGHFMRALVNVERPAALGGADGAFENEFLPFGAVTRDETAEAKHVCERVLDIGTSRTDENAITSLLLIGSHGTGRRTMLRDLVQARDFEFVRVVRPQQLVGYPVEVAVDILIGAFKDAYRAPTSFLLLEDLDILLGIGGQAMGRAIRVLLAAKPPAETQCQLVVAAISGTSALSMDMPFDWSVPVPPLSQRNIKQFIENASAFPSSAIYMCTPDEQEDLSNEIANLPPTAVDFHTLAAAVAETSTRTGEEPPAAGVRSCPVSVAVRQ